LLYAGLSSASSGRTRQHNCFPSALVKPDVEADGFGFAQNLPNVLVTPHQAFLTEEALCNIGATTVQNLSEFCSNSPLSNQVLPEADSQRTPRARAGGFGGALYM
jgi:hypothetical protein